MRGTDVYRSGYGKGIPNEDRVAKVLRLAKSLNAQSLLDVGCGDGSLTAALQEALGASDVYGVEISPRGSEAARRRGVRVFTLDVDVNPIPLPDGSVDLAYAGEILEHLYDPDHLLDEIFRVLHRNGLAIIDTPNLGVWYDRLSLMLGFQPQSTEVSLRHGSAGKLITSHVPGGGGHLRVLTLRAFVHLLRLHGFRVKRVLGASGKTRPEVLPPYLRGTYTILNHILSNLPSLAAFTVVLVEKP